MRWYGRILGIGLGCLLGLIAQAQPPEVRPWSVRMAESVMRQKPVLSERWHYEVGVMLRAFEALWYRTGDARYFEYIRTNIDRFVTPEGAIRTYEKEEYNLDQINTGKLLFLLYEQTGEERYRRAIDTLRDQLRHHPRTSGGGFWHKKNLSLSALARRRLHDGAVSGALRRDVRRRGSHRRNRP